MDIDAESPDAYAHITRSLGYHRKFSVPEKTLLNAVNISYYIIWLFKTYLMITFHLF